MTKHTPGPWTRSYGNYVYQGKDIANQGRIIAICEPTTRTQEDWDQVFANARLIAAAPDLLEALEDCLNSWQYGESITEGESEYNKARAAIAKAKGE